MKTVLTLIIIIISFQSQEIGRSTSPRATLIKKLEDEKKAKHKKQLEEQSNIKHGSLKSKDSERISGVRSLENMLKEGVNHKNEPLKSGVAKTLVDDENDDDEYESVSDSSDDSSDESSTDDDDDTNKDAAGNDKSHKNVQNDQYSGLKQFGIKDGRVQSLCDESRSKGKNDSVCSTDKKLERVLSYTGFTECSSSVSQTSESEQEFDLDDDDFDFSTGAEVENKEPLKSVTRKVAGRDDKNKFSFLNPASDKDTLQINLDGSAFVPKAKSPIVISKEKVSKLETFTNIQHDILKEETRFSYHSDSDSIGNKNNGSFSEGDDDDKSNDGEQSSRKSFGEKKTLQFDDDDEWGELTPKILKLRKRKDSENEHDKTLVEDMDGDKIVTG